MAKKKTHSNKKKASAGESTGTPAEPASSGSGGDSGKKTRRRNRTPVAAEQSGVKKKVRERREAIQGSPSQLDSFFEGQLEERRRQGNANDVFTLGQGSQVIIGIRAPLAFEYLIAQDVFPLGLVLHLTGEEKSNKTSLLYEFFRWFRRSGGGGFLFQNESKFSPELLQSIVCPGESRQVAIVEHTQAMEDWQEKLSWWVKREQKALDGTTQDPGPGRVIPMCFGVDSIAGKSTRAAQKDVASTGHGGKRFPDLAQGITDYMKGFVHELEDFPFALVLVNHVKQGMDEAGNAVRRTSGGKAVPYQESIELECSVKKSNITSAGTGEVDEEGNVDEGWDGMQLSIKCVRNSLGAHGRRIDTRMLWWQEEDENGDWYQVTQWDWGWSLVWLLHNIFTYQKGRMARRLKERGVHIEALRVSDVENLAYSKNLGMSRDDAVSWSRLGRMIEQDEDLSNRIRDALAIHERRLLVGDMHEQLEQEREQAADRAEQTEEAQSEGGDS